MSGRPHPNKSVAATLLRAAGWELVGRLPDFPRLVVIFAPHTSNWDFVLLLLVRSAFGARVHYLAKNTLFRFPYGWFFRLTGGIPVDRGQHHHLVANLARRFAEQPELWLAIAPEGTRTRTDHWRSGFYRIALAANVPVLCAFIDKSRKQCGVGDLLELSGDLDADLAKIRAFYADKRGIHPERESEIRFETSPE
jgi:1-acyl-sn-glycerol-3-phosphate acyltransferase